MTHGAMLADAADVMSLGCHIVVADGLGWGAAGRVPVNK